MEERPAKNQQKPRKSDDIKPYLRYSGLAFQMIGAMVIAAFAGRKLDAYVGTANPWFTIGLIMVAVVASMALVIVSLTRKK